MSKPVEDAARAGRNRALAERARRGDAEARATLIVENIGLGTYCAGRVARKFGRRASPDELVSLAAPGLIHAADHYDPASGEFAHYASRCVKGLALEALYADLLVRFPSRYFFREGCRYEAEASRVRQGFLPFYAAVDPGAADPGEVVQARDEREARAASVGRLLAPLDCRERTALAMRFGLDGHEPSLLDDIGTSFGMSVEGARRLILRALGKIRGKIGSPSPAR